MKSARNCVWIIFFLTISALVFDIIFNVSIDPYGIFRGNERDKPELAMHSYLTKVIGIIRKKPDFIIIGSSIVDRGFYIPGSTSISFDGLYDLKQAEMLKALNSSQPIYNAGVRGGGIYEVENYLYHAYKNNPHLKRAIIGLEWGMFTDARPRTRVFPEVSALDKTYIPFMLYLQQSLSLKTTLDSFATLRKNNQKINEYASIFTSRYQQLEDLITRKLSPPQEFALESIDRNSQKLIRARSEIETSDMLYSIWLIADLPKRLENNGPDALVSPEALASMRRIINFAKEKNIAVDIYVSPQHGVFWMTANQFGLSPFVDLWLRELAQITPFWDFSGAVDFNQAADSFFPNDCVHFINSVGEIILSAISKKSPQAERGINYVTQNNIESIIAYRHQLLNEWANKNKYLKDIYTHPDFAFMKNGWMPSLEKWNSPIKYKDYANILAVPCKQDYKRFKLFKFLGRYWAIPESNKPYDIRRIVMRDYKNMLVGDSLKDITGKVDNYAKSGMNYTTMASN